MNASTTRPISEQGFLGGDHMSLSLTIHSVDAIPKTNLSFLKIQQSLLRLDGIRNYNFNAVNPSIINLNHSFSI